MVLRPQNIGRKYCYRLGHKILGVGSTCLPESSRGAAEILNRGPPRVRVRGYRLTSPRAFIAWAVAPFKLLA